MAVLKFVLPNQFLKRIARAAREGQRTRKCVLETNKKSMTRALAAY